MEITPNQAKLLVASFWCLVQNGDRVASLLLLVVALQLQQYYVVHATNTQLHTSKNIPTQKPRVE